jgi:glutamine---fructose-6-phosphate transaminase (isomerizing)
VSGVIGATRYAIKDQTIAVIGRSGISVGLPSRTETDHRLLGTKLLVAEQRQPLVAIGRGDSRSVIIVPEITDDHTTGLVLLHVIFHEHLAPRTMKAVLDGYRGRLAWLRSAVTEIQPTFDERLLGRLPPLALLTAPVEALAHCWIQSN